MKALNVSVLVLLFFFQVLMSCSKDDDSTTLKNGFTLDGKLYETQYAMWYENEILGSELSLVNIKNPTSDSRINFVGIYGIHRVSGSYVNTFSFSETEMIDGTFESGEYIAARTGEEYDQDPEVLATGGTESGWEIKQIVNIVF